MEAIFARAFKHCRCTKKLRDAINTYIIIYNYNGMSFDNILLYVDSIFKTINGLGMLATIDVTEAICKNHNIYIDMIFIICSGPKNTLKMMNKEHLIKHHIVNHLNFYYKFTIKWSNTKNYMKNVVNILNHT